MPLRCVDHTTNEDIHAFDLSVDAWQALRTKNGRERHLQMPCCAASVTLKESHLGTRFFAHKAVGKCTTAAETEAHLRLKAMAVEVARAYGWQASTETAGTTPSGEPWIADVLAQKGDQRIAIEIQWSRQSNDETMRRQERYESSGIRCLWLLRHDGFPITQRLPAACIEGSASDGFLAVVPTRSEEQRMEARAFLEAAFSRRLRFGVPIGHTATVSARVAPMDCWSCGAETKFVTGFSVTFGPHMCEFTVPEIGEYPDLCELALHKLPTNLGLGPIERRFSTTQARSYMSNGCAHCGALIGEFYEIYARDDEYVVCSFPITLSERWREAIEGDDRHKLGWGVYSG